MSKLVRHDTRHLKDVLLLIGVDEAGRGAIAGPVCAGAVMISRHFIDSAQRKRHGRRINDSKQLSPAEREDLAGWILAMRNSGHIGAETAMANVQEIEELNILGATKLAMKRALQALEASEIIQLPTPGDEDSLFGDTLRADRHRPRILVDGKRLKGFAYTHTAIVDGDARSFCIALASIIAKVARDHHMVRLHQQYPQYGLADHKGYGTPVHRDALLRHGPSDVHRPLFVQSLLAGRPDPAQAHFSFE